MNIRGMASNWPYIPRSF